MEQTHTGEGHNDAVLVTLFDDQIVTDRAAGLCNILNTRSGTALDRVREREECIGAQCYSITGIQPCTLLLCSQGFRLNGEVILPNTICADILLIAVNIAIDDIIAAGTTQIGAERQIQCLGMLTQEPGISLAASQSDAVDSGLLTGADTDGLPS